MKLIMFDIDGTLSQTVAADREWFVLRAILVHLVEWVQKGKTPPPSRHPRLDFGPRFLTEGIADIIPPKAGKPFCALLPAVNADGNETSGIVLPEVAVPLGTYTGWNLRAVKVGADTMLSPLDGMFLPFAKTKAEREKTGDPRLSLEERYPTRRE